MLFQNLATHHLESIFPPLEPEQDFCNYLDEENVTCMPS